MECFPKRAIHLDFHTMPGVYDVGRDFDAGEFALTLKKAGVEYITAFARCNLGFAYYPTQSGLVHPGLQGKDLLGGMVSACHNEGIRVVAYINAGLDHEHALRHREWCKVNRNGQVAEAGNMGHFFRRMCLNTGYREHLIKMLEEVLEMYPVDGIFLDCFTPEPCYGVECLDGMKKAGMDVFDDDAARHYCRLITQKFMKDVTGLVRKKKRNAYIYFNGLPYAEQPTHIELEILPTGGWGYDYLPWAIRYARTLKKPFFTMTGRFHKSWGDFGGIRQENSLLFDCYNSIANGGTCSVGDHMHPRGPLDAEVYGLIGRVYSKVSKLEQWTYKSEPVADIAVVHPELALFPFCFSGDVRAAVAGAARMLMEMKCQFDVSDGQSDLSKYRIIILPDNVAVDAGLKKKLEKHLKNDGAIISSADAGLEQGKQKFALKEYQLSHLGPEEHDYAFFKAEKEVSRGIPNMPVTIYRPGAAIKAGKGAKVLCRLCKPYFNIASWDMRHENLYIPPEKDAGRPALVQCGNILHFSFPVFTGYFRDAVVAYKTLLGNCVGRVLRQPAVKADNLPSFVQVTLTRKGRARMIHLLAFIPELRGEKMQVIEEPITIKDVRIGLRTGGKKINKAYLAPSGRALECIEENNYAWITIPEVTGYQLVVFE